MNYELVTISGRLLYIKYKTVIKIDLQNSLLNKLL